MEQLEPNYVTGLVEGEGCFHIGLQPRKTGGVDWQVRPSFSFAQNKKNKKLVFLVKDFFGCGSIRPSRVDQMLKYDVRSLVCLRDKLIPHFEAYPLSGEKAKDFQNFAQIVNLISAGRHTQKPGLRQIVTLILDMNIGAKRRKSLYKVLTLLKV